VGVPAQVLGVPPILELVFGDQPVRDWRSYATTDWKLIVRWGHEMMRRGVFVNATSKLYVSVAHDDEAIDLAVATAEDALRAALARGDSR
jgi:glutamate-1-semialdehyde 2,1-aminomutase